MARTPAGEAIRRSRRTQRARKRLRGFEKGAKANGDLRTWHRARAVSAYIDGESVISIATTLGVTRGSVNHWIQWYDRMGIDGLRSRKPPGRPPRLTDKQRKELATTVENGPQCAGFTSGMWTGPMIGSFIRRRFGVRYHNHHIPRLLHQLGFSVQRPRKRLARANAEAQAVWLRERLPRIKKKLQPAVA